MSNPPIALKYNENTYLHVSSNRNYHPRAFSVIADSPEPHDHEDPHQDHPSADIPDDSSVTDSPKTLSRDLTRSTHSSTSSSSSAPSEILTYVGLVGQLDNEHLYCLPKPTKNPPDEETLDCKKWLESIPGVKRVEVMIPRKRHKTRFECPPEDCQG
ncbi:hypothetical protein BT69DRAFT_1317568 [Atractiella rhizophila]|nr:hypothetical protein BT69DRAFT_1317745 [Atractiella rhizophila]KAH8926448.1 hypothetical protein BT69DRAFT_1317568 [Atractiella rhizophila]